MNFITLISEDLFPEIEIKNILLYKYEAKLIYQCVMLVKNWYFFLSCFYTKC